MVDPPEEGPWFSRLLPTLCVRGQKSLSPLTVIARALPSGVGDSLTEARKTGRTEQIEEIGPGRIGSTEVNLSERRGQIVLSLLWRMRSIITPPEECARSRREMLLFGYCRFTIFGMPDFHCNRTESTLNR